MNSEDTQDKMKEMNLTQENTLKDAHDTTEDLSQTKHLNKTSQELDTVSIDNYIGNLFLDKNSTYGGHTYLVSKPVLVDVFKFNSMCMIEGGYLVEINNENELNFVSSFYISSYNPNREDLIIGMTDLGHANHYKYINSGKSVTYLKWMDGKPDHSDTDNCGYLLYPKMVMFITKCKDSKIMRFMCEIPE